MRKCGIKKKKEQIDIETFNGCAKLPWEIYDARKQLPIGGVQADVSFWKGTFLSDKNVLCLDLDAGYMGRYIWQNSRSCTLKTCAFHRFWDFG